jgi:hypothetical protein
MEPFLSACGAAVPSAKLLKYPDPRAYLPRHPRDLPKIPRYSSAGSFVKDHVSSFPVHLTAESCGQPVVLPGTPRETRVLAGTTSTNSGANVVIGHLGVGPGTAVTEFSTGTVNGSRGSDFVVAR